MVILLVNCSVTALALLSTTIRAIETLGGRREGACSVVHT